MKRLFSCLLITVGLIGVGCHNLSLNRDLRETSATAARLSPAISAEDLQIDVTFLASDECKGRLTGSPGAARAARYIATVLSNAGLQPLGENDSYYQPFEFTAGVRQVPGKNRMEILGPSGADVAATCQLDTDFRPLAYSNDGSVEAEVVFAGYGLVEPASEGAGYDSYAGLDVSGAFSNPSKLGVAAVAEL